MIAESPVNAAQVILSRSPGASPAWQAFDDALVDRLAVAGMASRLLIVPHIYYLSPQGTVAVRLAALGGKVVLATWLHPRAARWTLAALGRPDVGDVAAVGLRNFDSPEAAASAILAAAGAGDLGREAARAAALECIEEAVQHRWYPVLDDERCRNCKQCHDFCLFGVYSLDGAGRVRVARPENCKPGCPACSRICPTKAIMFPHHEAEPWIAGGDQAASPGEAVSAGGPSSESGGEVPVSRSAAGPDARDELDDLIDSLDRLDAT